MKTKYEDNDVDMPNSSGYTIQKGTFTITDFRITNGEDDDKHIAVGQERSYSGSGSMRFSVGRKGSSDVAKWWKARISSHQNTFNHDPDELNFAFIGQLAITITGGKLGSVSDTYTITDAAFAQGHSDSSNNWWFGGKNCSCTSENTVKCTAISSSGFSVYFSFLRGGKGNPVNAVQLTNIEIPAYTTFALQPTYAGESTSRTWQDKHKCPPYVVYYDTPTKSTTLKLVVQNNLLYNSVGDLFDTSGADVAHGGQPAAIFVVGSDATVYASNVNKVFLFHHSSILAGAPVLSAGTLKAQNGIISEMSAASNHYKPTPDTAYVQLKEVLHRQGYTREFKQTAFMPQDLLY